jgi:glycosyltransferase involved in cell wall biosynthesis
VRNEAVEFCSLGNYKNGNGLIVKIAILGARGIPACYSGYDTLVEELSVGLVASHSTEVLVYCRSSYYRDQPASWHGVRLVYLNAPQLKALESLVASFLSSLHVLRENPDVVYFLDPANAPFCVLLRCCGKRVVIHTDGLGWKRRKWGAIARRYYKMVEWVCAKCGSALITDNPAMQEYYRDEYGAETFFISYGATNRHGVDTNIYAELGLIPKQYLLIVARLEPENNTDLLIAQYTKSGVKIPLVVVGDAPYGPVYMDRLKTLANAQVLFPGRINDQAKLNALYRGAYLYIHGHEVGGTNPSLLRAMDAGVAPVVVDVPFNTSVVDGGGVVFDKHDDSLAAALHHLVDHKAEVQQIGQRASLRAASQFSWDTVVAKHHDLFLRLTSTSKVAPATSSTQE